MARLTALVIGNGGYEEGTKLANPTNDAKDIAAKLTDGGFEVTTLIDADYKTMRKATKAFAKASEGGDVALMFFAGHGVQVEGVNYLLAVDTPVDDQTDVEHGALSLDEVIRRMETAAANTNIIVLDACRDNPWDRKWRGAPRGLAPIYAPKGTLVAFATSPGQLASDGAGRNGAYTSALLKHIDAEDLPLEAMFKRVRNSLSAATNGKQISWEHTSLAGEFYFNLSAAARIDGYGATAIRDKSFALDEAKASHVTIRKLKSYNWYTQNAALDELDLAKLAKSHPDNLFVLGRNILQAASGHANTAISWVNNFPRHLQDLAPEKRRAVLDGILFEIFFDAEGQLRKRPKARLFSEAFALQRYPDLKPSFDFIAGALAPHAGRMFALPGKNHAVSVDVRLGKGGEVSGVYVGGKDHLHIDKDELSGLLDEGDERIVYRKQDRDDFENDLAKAMLVPRHLLSVVYEPKARDELLIPYGFEILSPGDAAPA